MRPRIAFRRWRKWAVILAIFAIGIPVSAAITIRGAEAHHRLRSLATTAIQDELGLRASLGRVHLELVPLGIVAEDVALDDPVYGRLADAERIVVRPSFGALLRGRVDLEELELRGAQVHLVIRDGAIRNVPKIDTGETGGSSHLPFGRLTIIDSVLSVDAGPMESGELEDIDIVVEAKPGGVISVFAHVPRGHLTRYGVRHESFGLDAHIELSPDTVHVHELEAHLGSLHTTIHHGLIPLPPPDPTLPGASGYAGEIELSAELEHLRQLALPLTIPEMHGRLSVRARIRDDRTEGQRAVGTVELENGRILEFGLGQHIHLPFVANRNEIRVNDAVIEVVGNGGRLNINGTLGLRPDLPLDAEVHLHGFSFAHLMEQLDVSANSIVEWIFDGRMVLRGSIRDVDLRGAIDLRTRDFVVSTGPYHARPLDPVIAIPRGTFRGSWSIRPDAIRFSDLVGVLPHSRILGDVHLGFDNLLRVDARADPADLRDISHISRFAVAGTGRADCHIDGTFQAPHVTGHVRLADFEFDGMRIGDVESDARLDPDGMGVLFPHVVAAKAESRYAANDVYLDFRENRFRMSGRLELDRMRLTDFYHVFGLEADERFTPYQGLAHGRAEIAFTSGFPSDSPSGTLDVHTDLAFSEISLDGISFTQSEAIGHFRWLDWSRGIAGAELELAHATLRKGSGTVALSGRMELGGRLQMIAAADALSLRDIEGVGDRLPSLDGIVSATADVGGTATEMRLDKDVGFTNMMYGGRSIGDGRAYVRMTHQGDSWVQDALSPALAPDAQDCMRARRGLARANWAPDPPLRTIDGLMPRQSNPSAFLICGSALDGRLNIDLAIGRTTQYPMRGRIAWDGLDLSPFLPDLMSSGPHHAHGKMSGELMVDGGALRDPAALEAHLLVSEFELGHGDLVLANRGPIVVTLKNGIARVERARLRGPDARMRVRGQYALPTESTNGGLALSLEGHVDLGVLTRMTSAIIEADGQIEARLAISGPLSDPEIYGEARIEDGFVRALGVPTPLSEVGARITFSARSIQFDDIHMQVAHGTVRGRGEARIADGAIERWALQLRGADLFLTPAEGLDVALSTDLEVAWTRGERLPTARGELSIERLTFSRNIDLGTTLGDLARTQRAIVERYDPGRERIMLDLRIASEQPFVVRNNLLEAELVIDDTQRPFRIVGTDQRFGMLGNMEFTRGRIFFRNSVFDLRTGFLSFDDETRIDPSFRIDAVSEIRRSGDLAGARWRILLDAHGSLESFQIGTRSDPDLPQEDILMLLAVGMTRSEFEQLQAGDVGSTAALEALTQLSGVDREVRRAVPLIDDFRITSAYSLRTGRTEPQVSVGKRIADRVRVSATTGVGAGEARDFRALVDMQLDDTTGVQCSYDNFTTTASASSFGNVGCDLRWRLEFE